MKTKHRKASQHKRRWQKDYGVLARVMNRLEPFTEDELARLLLPIRMSFDALRNGVGTEQDFLDVVAACNSASMRGAEVDPLCQQTAVAGLEALRRCGSATSVWGSGVLMARGWLMWSWRLACMSSWCA
jgi:hypothetical protein